MYIKQIEIDGFKSYSQKQILTKFDTEFNAITGLNGSGKSNILDSICFVLGITDLKCIRAENMNALVYKSGQAGITKAAVTITFNNTDKSTSPYGYDTYDEIIVRRQVIVNGGTKYTINGSMVSNQKIFDFFRSVGLNVNNPHFLIMQGRITKVLNMKPIEILGMLEEAAGTKMYDQKRNQAIHFIEKKQQKVDEITNLLDTEIQPKVSRLKEEKQQFLNHQKITRDVDILKKQIDAFDYYMYLQDEKRLREDAEKLAEELEESELQIAEKRVEEQTLKQKIADMEAKKLEGSSEEKIRLEREIAVVKQTRVEAEADRDTILQQVTETQRNIDELAEENARERVTLEETDRRLRKEEASLGGEEEQGKTAEAEIKQAKQALDNLAKGQVTDEEGKATSLVEKITNARTALREAETNVKTSQMWLRSNEPKLDERRRRLDQMSKQSSSDTKEIEQQEAEIRRCEADLKKCNFDEERYEHLETRKQELRELIRNNGSRLNSILERNKHLQFVYDQHRVWAGFDEESEIIGPISSLFKVKDSRFNTALAIIASSRIYNWVFAHSQTAAAFMDKKLIQQRKTIISLDCIQDRDPRTFENRVAIARKMCEDRGEEFYTAIELLEFDPKYQKVINFIFAGICVVNNHKLASDLAFASAVRLRVVTTDGDDVKPDGSLSGGTSKNEQENILTRLEGYYDTNLRQKNYRNEQRRIDQELEHLQPLRGEFEKLRNGLERARGRFEVLRESLKDSPLQMLRDEIQQLETDIPKHNEIIQKSQREVKELAETIQKYEKEGNDEKALFAKEKDKWTKKMKEAEKLLKSMKSRYENACSTLERLRKEKEKIENTIKQQDAEITEQQARKDQLAAELTTKEQKLQEALQEENRKQAEQDRFQAEQKEKDKAIKKNEKELDKLKKDLRDQEQDQQNKQRQHKKHLEDAVACKSQAAQLKKSCKTIADIEGSLGKEGDYSFKGFEKKKAAANYEKLKEQIKEMERTLNPKAHAILDSAEAQVSDLVSKIATIEKDKRTLYQTIDTLDDKKRREIMRAWEQVNQDFDHIFGTLLKGAQAKLEPPAGKTALDGLEVKVGFNNQFKDSLNELSGGQRSLVALSLVLAMLKFKPAPIYILDEVDAALDASHTANIGKMIKKYFTTSQFIIVSLKEGMFENANILFKTKFVDGTSQVTRTAGLSADEKRTMQRDAEEAQKAARAANEAKKKTAKGKENAA